jgi:exopolysaccharide production protein ExoZ
MRDSSAVSGPSANRGVFASIQSLRAVAALAVVLFHEGVLKTGYGGVDIFFVISGFIMGAVGTGDSVSGFLAKRIVRIAPLYWAVTLLMCAISLSPGAFRHFAFDVPSLAKSLFFIPYRDLSGEIEPLVVSGWTLAYEMFFYAIFALGLAIRRPFAVAYGVIASLVIFGMTMQPANAVLQTYSSPLLLEFAAGLLIAQALPHLGERFGRTALVLACVLFSLVVILEVGEGRTLVRTLVFGIPSFLLVAGAVALERTGCWRRSPLLERLGDASYSLYLLHGLVIALSHRFLPLPQPFNAAFVIAVSILVSLASYRLFERPIAHFMRDGLGRARQIASRVDLRTTSV